MHPSTFSLHYSPASINPISKLHKFLIQPDLFEVNQNTQHAAEHVSDKEYTFKQQVIPILGEGRGTWLINE